METFRKSERLNNKNSITDLFKSGRGITLSPLSLIWISSNKSDGLTLQVMISVPKKNIKSAVKRNLIRRRINEAFRLHKASLYTNLELMNKKLKFAIIYQRKEIDSYNSIKQKINLLLDRLLKEI